MFFIVILRISGRKGADELKRLLAGIDHHMTLPGRNEESISRPDLDHSSFHPGLAATLLNVNHFFHSRMAVRVTRTGLPHGKNLYEPKRDALRFEFSVRDQLAE